MLKAKFCQFYAHCHFPRKSLTCFPPSAHLILMFQNIAFLIWKLVRFTSSQIKMMFQALNGRCQKRITTMSQWTGINSSRLSRRKIRNQDLTYLNPIEKTWLSMLVPPFDSPATKPADSYNTFLSKKSQIKTKEMMLHHFYLDKVAFNPSTDLISNLWDSDCFFGFFQMILQVLVFSSVLKLCWLKHLNWRKREIFV